MWIRTQNKQMLINSDQIVDIFINKVGDTIYAETTIDRDFIRLGEYKDRDTCLEVLEVIMIVGGHKDVTYLQLPLGGDVEQWLEDIHRIAEKIYN